MQFGTGKLGTCHFRKKRETKRISAVLVDDIFRIVSQVMCSMDAGRGCIMCVHHRENCIMQKIRPDCNIFSLSLFPEKVAFCGNGGGWFCFIVQTSSKARIYPAIEPEKHLYLSAFYTSPLYLSIYTTLYIWD